MLAPISWLKDYVDIEVTPEVLAKKLVSIGFEVDEIIYQEKQVSNVVTGKIIKVEQHPNADKLKVTQIDIGSKTIQVITNCPVTEGEIIGVALDGAKLMGGTEIKSGPLRGVLSEGMLCGLEEVGVTEDDVQDQKMGDYLKFKEGTVLGENVLKVLGFCDVILDVEVTANRPDCNSIYKLAKEVAVALKTSCREPEINYQTKGGNINDVVSVDVKNSSLCPRYMAAAVKNVKIFPSSQKIKSRLRAVGIRPINNIVDITNYVLTEIGQPMHSFDKRELTGNKIVVRNAENGETIVSLDGKENKLNDSMLVICDDHRPVAVAGIMGGQNSGIQPDTNEVVFESAKFMRDNVRRTSKALNLRSDSSARFEKGIDFASQEYGLKRALTLVYESNSGDIVDGIIDQSVEFKKVNEIRFTTKKIQEILGCKVPKAQLIAILDRLGIAVKEEGKELVAVVKEDREDIVGVNDIAEEFIRVYGYSHVKPTLFEFASLTKGGMTEKMSFVNTVKEALSSTGLNECVTYSFTTPKFADMMGLSEDDSLRKAVKIVNPLGEALSVMRTTLTHSMLDTMVYNIKHFNKSAKLFEIAKVYLPKELPLTELPYEEEKLAIGMYGDDADFFTIKGALDELFAAINVEPKFVRSDKVFLHPGRSAEVIIDGENIGFVGELHPDTTDRYDISNFRLYVAEISIDKLLTKVKGLKQFSAFSKFPIIERDLAVVVDDAVLAQDLTDAVKTAKINFLKDISIFDTYKSDQIGKGKKSVALSFSFESLDRTLKDEEIAVEMDKILAALKRKCKAKIR